MQTINPMLAKDAGDLAGGLFQSDDWIAEPKIDGERAMLYIDLIGSSVIGRRVSVKTGQLSDKSNNLPHMKALRLPASISGAVVLDGELDLEHGHSFTSLTSILGSKPDRAIELQREHGLVGYDAFDIVRFNGKDISELPWLQRRELLEAFYDAIHAAAPWLRITQVISGPDKKAFYDSYVLGGGEGVMLKNVHAPYVQKRSGDWRKVKKTATYEGFILGYELGKGKYNTDKIGAIILGAWVPEGAYPDLQRWNDVLQGKDVAKIASPAIRLAEHGIEAPDDGRHELVLWATAAGLTAETIAELTTRPLENLGRVLEVECNGAFPTGRLRHPRFYRWREKTTQECVIPDTLTAV